MIIFDYFFYRVFIFYNRKRDELPILRGCLVITLMLFLSLLSLITLFSIFTDHEIDSNIKPFSIFVMIIILILIWKRYTRNDYASKLVDRFKNEKPSSKYIRGWLFIIYLLLVFAIPISIGYMRHNLGMDI